MTGFRGTNISTALVLFAMTWRAAGDTVSHPSAGVGLVLALAGGLILTLPEVRHGHAIRALSAAAVTLTVCWASTGLLKPLAWRIVDVPLPSVVCTMVSKTLPGAAGSDGLITFWTGRALDMVRVTFGAVGIYEIWYILVALVTFIGFSGIRLTRRRVTSMLAGLAVYAPLRFMVLTAVAVELGKAGIFWQAPYAVISWLPLAGVLNWSLSDVNWPERSCEWTHMFRFPHVRLRWLEVVPVCAGILVVIGLGYDDPGNLKRGRLVIDETHANWEWVTEPFDTTAYGIRAEYNYYCLCEYLKNFYDVEVNSEGISSSVLDSADVLIIKTPTEPFASEEIEAMSRFVAKGGGLLLIGDHTNLFGMSTYLNTIAERFGMRFRHDDTFDIETTGFSRYRRSSLCFHPCLRGVREFDFLTSCSIIGDLHTRPVLAGYGLGSEEIDYSHPNFFGNMTFDMCDRFGVLLQASARTFGDGRVLLFTDSTCLSNFCIFSPGTTELVLGFTDYLNREGRRYGFVIPLVGSLLTFLGCVLLWNMKRGKIGGGWTCLGLLIGLIVGVCCISHMNAALYGPLPRAVLRRSLLFDIEHTDASFFNYLAPSPSPRGLGFEEVFLCAQRIGSHPYAGGLSEIEQSPPAAVVIVNPCKGFSEKERAGLDAYLTSGGKVLVLDSVLNTRSTSGEILSRHGVGLSVVPWASETASSGDLHIAPRLVVSGGVAVRGEAGRHRIDEDPDDRSVVFVRVGSGLLVVATDSFRYSHHVLGRVLERSRPGPVVRDVYRELYRLLRIIVMQDAL